MTWQEAGDGEDGGESKGQKDTAPDGGDEAAVEVRPHAAIRRFSRSPPHRVVSLSETSTRSFISGIERSNQTYNQHISVHAGGRW
jgi:hypothetical protein